MGRLRVKRDPAEKSVFFFQSVLMCPLKAFRPAKLIVARVSDFPVTEFCRGVEGDFSIFSRDFLHERVYRILFFFCVKNAIPIEIRYIEFVCSIKKETPGTLSERFSNNYRFAILIIVVLIIVITRAIL